MCNRSDPPGWIRQLVFLLSLPAIAFAQTLSQGNYTALSDAFWQLGGLIEAPELLGHSWDPLKGGQNFTHCCLLAINDSLQVVDGYIVNTTTWINATVDELISATQNDQFPCTAVWNGNNQGAYVVEVPWPWYEDNCKGWELSDSRKGDESQWIQPFVGFLLPAVVFCKFSLPHLQNEPMLTLTRRHYPSSEETRRLAEVILSRYVAGCFMVGSAFCNDCSRALRRLRHSGMAINVLCICKPNAIEWYIRSLSG